MGASCIRKYSYFARMKHLYILLVCCPLLFMCYDAQKIPIGVVKEYLIAVDNLEFQEAEKFLIPNEENRMAIENMKKFRDNMASSEQEAYKSKIKIYDFKEGEVSEEKAIVFATNNQGGYLLVVEFELVKKEGKWFIDRFRSD